ncbi:MAG: 50S ribosomal protein L10 [Candidatus Aenigmarchaeota archaeon]|nr:50S ribosomal protein L10 [Candidatus Aenigmarchaeota archaeon]
MVATKKIKSRENIAKLLKSHKSVILFDLANLPSGQLHKLRNALKAKEIYTVVGKKRVLQRAIEEARISLNLDEAKQPAIVYSNKGIFEVTKALKEVKTNRKAKAGEEVPADITLPAGPTPAQAGPAISIFKTFQIQTMIKDGKISIKDPKTVCKKGDKVPFELVSLLNMLGVTPIEMSIAPQVGYSENMFYTREVFDIDPEFVRNQVLAASGNITKVTYKIGYPTKQNAELLLVKGWRGARQIGIRAGIPSKELMEDLVRAAHLGAKKLEK